MKQGEKPELSAAWWKRSQPKGLRTADRLEDAFKEWEGAERKMARAADPETLDLAEESLEDIDTATRAVIAEAKRAKSKTNPEMDWTVNCLEQLPRLTDAQRKKIEKLQEDADARIFATPDSYRAYLLVGLKRMHSGTPMNFAMVLGRAPEDHRMALHKSKSQKSLLTMLVRETKLHQGTWGKAAADQNRDGMIVMALDGKQLPGLAKRATLMLHAYQPLPYKKVRLKVEGKDADDLEDDA
ncbi:MAG: hypothetical protein KGI51_10325 [Rhodospirillales bacterium]|nr:hypothetical protein [Rhodospirillales bacterium]